MNDKKNIIGPKAAAASIRKDKILNEARNQLLSLGYNKASLNEIARIAGGSKATIVKYFGNKEGLFAEVLSQSAKQMAFKLDEELKSLNRANLQSDLQKAGEIILEFYLSNDALTIYRAVISSNSSLAQIFYDSGHKIVVSAIASILELWENKLSIPRDELNHAAGIFTHMIREGIYEKSLIRIIDNNEAKKEIKQTIELAVRLFINGLNKNHI